MNNTKNFRYIYAVFFGVLFLFSLFFILAFLSNFRSTFLFNNINNLPNNTTNINLKFSLDLNLVEEVINLIQDNYIKQLPSREKLNDGILKGVLWSLDDPYAEYLTKEESKIYKESKNPDFEGIGVLLRFNGNNTEIENVFENSPAYLAGLKSDDEILSVNSESMLNKKPYFVSTKIRGPKGTFVEIEISRGENIIKYNIKRDKINVDNVVYKILGERNDVVLIKISQFIDINPFVFNQSWDRVVEAVVKSSNFQNYKAIILDLRNNPGGYVSSVRYVIDEFVENGNLILIEENNKGERIEFRTNRNGKFEHLPLYVLVNEYSASASEILALAIKDNKRGLIVGKTTLGKGIEQKVIDNLSNGGTIIIPFQKWLSPSGFNPDKDNQVKPDIQVDLDLDLLYKQKIDTQIQSILSLIYK